MAITRQQIGPQDHGETKRYTERIHLGVDVNLRSGHKFFVGRSENISRGGIFVATKIVHKLGEQVKLKLRIGDLPAQDYHGVVRWCRPADEAQRQEQGIGIEFDQLTPEQTSALNHFVQSASRRNRMYHPTDQEISAISDEDLDRYQSGERDKKKKKKKLRLGLFGR